MKWSKKEILYIKENSHKHTLQEICKILNREYRSVQVKIQRMKVPYIKGTPIKKFIKCINCSKLTKNSKFCSSSCSATFINKLRGPKSEEFKRKVSLKLKKPRPKCKLCNKCCNKTHNIYCSKTCRDLDPELKDKQSKIAKKRYKDFPEKHPNRKCAGIKESYPEKSFRWFLEKEKIPFIQQYKIERYYVDFFLPSLNLLIEIDGERWHDLTKESEIKRQNILEKYHPVLRYNAKDIINRNFKLVGVDGVKPPEA